MFSEVQACRSTQGEVAQLLCKGLGDGGWSQAGTKNRLIASFGVLFYSLLPGKETLQNI